MKNFLKKSINNYRCKKIVPLAIVAALLSGCIPTPATNSDTEREYPQDLTGELVPVNTNEALIKMIERPDNSNNNNSNSSKDINATKPKKLVK